MRSRYLALTLVIAILLASVIYFAVPISAEEVPYGPWLDEVVFMEERSTAKAVEMLDKGDIHMYLWYLTGENLEKALKSPRIEVVPSYAGMFDLFVNPIDTRNYTGEFNPFCIREVREALNYIIDRDYIVREILKGRGVPMITVFRPNTPDYVRNIEFMKAMESKYRYDFDKGKAIIFDALYKAGCEFKGGKWYYKGKPIKIRIFIRIEDERKLIGEYVASVLEKLGFEVEKIYGPAMKAWEVVYGGDPRKGQWHLYTEGWAFTAITAYDDDLPYYMYCSEWTGTVFEYYKPSPVLVDLATKLLNAKYKSMEERNEWVRKLTELCLKDSTRVWLVLQETPFPYSAKLRAPAYDLIGGFYTIFSVRTAKYKEKIGGSIKVAQRRMFVSAFNPVGGVKWLYEYVIWAQVVDPGVYPHPHTGEYIPVRAKFTVETAGPEGKLPVPPDALKFDPATKKWVKVGPGVNATSKITFEFIMGKWHHGQPITIADIMMVIAEAFRITYEKDPLYDPASITPTMQTFVRTFKGLKILGPNKIEIYLDYWHIDDTYIAYMADVWPSVPWEVYALMNKAVEDRKLAFSDSRAKEWGVEWLDLWKGPSIPILKEYLDKLKAENYIPEEIKEWVKPEEAKARWEALAKWYEKYGHFLVSNGPFIAYKADPAAKMAVLKAFREYPLKADYWDWLLKPRVPEIKVAKMPDIVPGMEAKIELTSTFEGKPYDKVRIKVSFVGPAGAAVITKDAKRVGPGKFEVLLTPEDTGRLTPGVYTVEVIAVGEEAALPKIVSTSAKVIPEIMYFETRVKELETKLGGDIEDIRGSISRLEDTISDLSASISGLSAQISTVMSLSIVAIVLAIIAIALAAVLARRKPASK